VEGSGHGLVLGIKQLACRTEENSNNTQSLDWNLNMEWEC
jgi:hypothetical protein